VTSFAQEGWGGGAHRRAVSRSAFQRADTSSDRAGPLPRPSADDGKASTKKSAHGLGGEKAQCTTDDHSGCFRGGGARPTPGPPSDGRRQLEGTCVNNELGPAAKAGRRKGTSKYKSAQRRWVGCRTEEETGGALARGAASSRSCRATARKPRSGHRVVPRSCQDLVEDLEIWSPWVGVARSSVRCRDG